MIEEEFLKVPGSGAEHVTILESDGPLNIGMVIPNECDHCGTYWSVVVFTSADATLERDSYKLGTVDTRDEAVDEVVTQYELYGMNSVFDQRD